MSSVVVFPDRRSTSAPSLQPPPRGTRDELGRLVDGLCVLAITRPAAVLAIKEIVLGLLADGPPSNPA